MSAKEIHSGIPPGSSFEALRTFEEVPSCLRASQPQVLAGLCIVIIAACSGKSNRQPQTQLSGAAGDTIAMSDGGAGGAASQGGSAALGGSASAGGTTGAAAASTTGGSVEGGAAGEAGAAGAPSIVEEPRPYRALQVVAAALHSCALLEDHRVKCWGVNDLGELGLGDQQTRGLNPAEMGDALPFVDLGTGRTARELATGRYSTCAILDDGSVKCWGLGIFGPSDTPQGIGPNQMGDNLAPIPLPPSTTATSIAIGFYQACALLNDNNFLCTGPSVIPGAPDVKALRLFGKTGLLASFADGSVRPVGGDLVPAQPLATDVTSVASCDRMHCLLLSSTALICDGAGPGKPSSLPATRDMDLAETGDLCVIDANGAVQCWGFRDRAPAWAPSITNPLPVPLPEPAVQISGGRDHHCAVLEDGSVACWNWWEGPNAAVGSASDTFPTRVNLGTYFPPQ